MGRVIEVTPQELISAAQSIEGLAADYKTLYSQLYQKTDSMASSWQYKDNQAYINQINGFKDDLEKMKNLMDTYAQFLRKSADAYQKTQDEITNRAKQLKN